MKFLRLPMHILLEPYYPVNHAVDLYYTADAKLLPSRVRLPVIRTSFYSSIPIVNGRLTCMNCEECGTLVTDIARKVSKPS